MLAPGIDVDLEERAALERVSFVVDARLRQSEVRGDLGGGEFRGREDEGDAVAGARGGADEGEAGDPASSARPEEGELVESVGEAEDGAPSEREAVAPLAWAVNG